MGVTFLCREVDRSTGMVAVYPVGTATDSGSPLLFELEIRQRLNPELQYFAVIDEEYSENKDEIEDVLGRSELPCKETLLSYRIVHV